MCQFYSFMPLVDVFEQCQEDCTWTAMKYIFGRILKQGGNMYINTDIVKQFVPETQRCMTANIF